MNETMWAVVHRGPGDLQLERVPRPSPAPGEALVQVVGTALSGADGAALFSDMPMDGQPVIPGHEITGIVRAVNADPQFAEWVGRPVVLKSRLPCRRCAYCEMGAYSQCLEPVILGQQRPGGLAESICAPLTSLVVLPSGHAGPEVALIEPAVTALCAVRQARIEPGQSVAILGSGTLGMLAAQWVRVAGAYDVFIIDHDESRLAVAQTLWLGERCNSSPVDSVRWIQARTQGRGADLVMDTAGTADALEQAVRMARPLGHLVILARPLADMHLPQATAARIVDKAPTLKGVGGPDDASLSVDPWRLSVDTWTSGRINLRELVSHRVALSGVVDLLKQLQDEGDCHLRILVSPERATE